MTVGGSRLFEETIYSLFTLQNIQTILSKRKRERKGDLREVLVSDRWSWWRGLEGIGFGDNPPPGITHGFQSSSCSKRTNRSKI